MKLALFGHGGHAREVAVQINKEVTFFVDDEYVNEYTKPISEFNPETHMMMVAVADSQERKRISIVQTQVAKILELKKTNKIVLKK
jgi:hypothetical protein